MSKIALESYRNAFIVIGLLDLICLMVILTPLLFKRLRQRLFLRIIAIISLADCGTAVSLILNLFRPVGDLKNDNLCEFQGILLNFSQKASISWTIALSIQLYTFIKYAKPYFSRLHMHLIFWAIPIFFEILPIFVGEPYGMDDANPEFALSNCLLRTNPNDISGSTAVFLIEYLFYLPFTMVILVIFYVLTRREIERKGDSQDLFAVTRTMSLYPLAMFLCQMPTILYIIYVNIPQKEANLREQLEFQLVASLIQAVYPIAVTLIFFYSCKEARQNWYVMLTKCTTNELLMMKLEPTILKASVGDEDRWEICDNDIDEKEQDKEQASSSSLASKEFVLNSFMSDGNNQASYTSDSHMSASRSMGRKSFNVSHINDNLLNS